MRAGQFVDSAPDKIGALSRVFNVLIDKPLIERDLVIIAEWLTETDEYEPRHGFRSSGVR